jgi:transcriptional regulator with PAS, ATPase and Fis domain
MIGSSPAMQTVYDLIAKVAPTEATVLLTGESGTGKELVAETIHELSERRGGPFMAVNCGAVSPTLIESELFGHERGAFTGAAQRHQGHFERAAGGTIFLDEITEAPPEAQVKLLRVLETRKLMRLGGTEDVPIDVRVIAATNRPPLQAVADGKLREDLFYRLNVFPIGLPRLRDRVGDAGRTSPRTSALLNKEAPGEAPVDRVRASAPACLAGERAS